MTGCNVKKHPLHISISLEDVLSAIALKKAVGNIEDCPLVAIHPCANAVFKEWPLDRFAEIGRHLVKNKKCRIAILGAAGRDELLADILAKRIGSGVVDISGKTPFRTLLAFLKLCDMYIGNDSGPMHLAAAAGCPTVAIFGATNPTRFGHYLPDRLKRVVVSSEFSHSYAVNASQMGEIMLRTVSVKMVTDAIDDLWSIVFDRLKSRSNGQNNDL
jgi:ADP-heptose:LPS heptosyltransferase